MTIYNDGEFKMFDDYYNKKKSLYGFGVFRSFNIFNIFKINKTKKFNKVVVVPLQ
jgi:hypothetical protein